MLDTLCSLPLDSDLFALSIHPTEPLCAVGLSSGHVQSYRLPSDTSPSNASVASNSSERSNGTSQIETAWKTRRHKGSCRALGYSHDGRQLFSAGTDGLVKGAHSETGVVEWKIRLPEDPANGKSETPALLHALTPQTLLLATDSSALHLYDLRVATERTPAGIASRPSSTYHPHDDYVSSLTPLPPSETSTSGLPKQWVSTGSTTLAVTDLRRGVLVRSEDQEEELLSSCIVTGLGSRGTSTGSKVVVGGADGVLTLWERGVWDDQDERITVDRGPQGGDGVDCIAQLPDELALGKVVAVGLGSGLVRFVRIGSNQVIGECSHDEVEGVLGLGFDVGGRMISGGGQVVKVWGEVVGENDLDDDDEALEAHDLRKRALDGSDDSEDDEAEDDSDSDEERKSKQKRKKRKRNKGKHLNGKVNTFSFGGLD